MLKNIKIGLRMGLSFGLMFVLIIVLILVSLNSLKTNNAEMEKIVLVENSATRYANNLIDKTREVSILLRNILLLNDNEQKKLEINTIDEIRKTYDDNLKNFDALFAKEDTAVVFYISKIKLIQEEARRLNNRVIEMTMANQNDKAIDLMNREASPKVAQWISAIDALVKHEEAHSLIIYNEAQLDYTNVRRFTYILGVIAIAIALIVSILLTRSITVPLKMNVEAALRIASNDLTVTILSDNRRDEVGILTQTFRQMVENLRESVNDINEGVSLLGSSASEILAATSEVTSGTAETASAISETTTTVEEVQQAAKLSAQKAKNVADNAQRLTEISEKGQKAVDESIAGMNRIREQMNSIAQTIIRLSEQSQSIAGIIASVTDIADQSNLLSVNAAIEAAKAGEYGKGFAVVAQEIKNLAGQSKLSTLQVKSILNDIQKATSDAALAMEKGSNAVEVGVKQSVQAGEAIRVLAEASNEALQAATQIVVSSQQQVNGMDQIGIAMQNINQAGSEIAVSMIQSEKAARNLYDLGQKLNNLVKRFKV